MERFSKTKFFLAVLSIRDRKSCHSINWKCIYDEFANLLFTEKVAMDTDKYHDALIYTRVELESLIKGMEKKRGNLC